jgi:hypothetical protein
MFEETGGEPYDGNYNPIYNNANTVGLRNGRNVKKGVDVPLKKDYHLMNNGFPTQGTQEYGTGPKTFYELATFWYKYAKSYISQVDYTPPLFIRMEVPGDRYFDTIQFLWNDRDTGGKEDWSAFAVRVVKAGYCSVGDVIAKNTELIEQNIEQNDTNDDRTFRFNKPKHLLFAHKRICINCPPKEIARWDEYSNFKSKWDPLGWLPDEGTKYAKVWNSYGPRRLYIADVSGLTGSTYGGTYNSKEPLYSDLYQPIGIYADRNILDAKKNRVKHNEDRYNPDIKPIVNPVAVLKTALFYYTSSYNTWTVIDDRDSKNGHLYTNPTTYNIDNVILVDSPNDKIFFQFNPQVAFLSILDYYINEQGGDIKIVDDKINYDKQNLNGDLTMKHDFFRGLCSLSPIITGYEDICACVGKGNEVAEYKKILPDFSMYCQSSKCRNGNAEKKVYKFEQETEAECPTIEICQINLQGTALEQFSFLSVNEICPDTKTDLSPNTSIMVQNTGSRWLHVSLFVTIAMFVIIILMFWFKIKK